MPDEEKDNGEDEAGGGVVMPLSLPGDETKLTAYQILLREQLEVFVAQENDAGSTLQGRKKEILHGQVGLRCRHCRGIPSPALKGVDSRKSKRGAVYFPRKLSCVYQACQNISTSHLLESCTRIPTRLRQELQRLRDRHDTAIGGKKYWSDACEELGVYETEDGLFFKRSVDRKPDAGPKGGAAGSRE